MARLRLQEKIITIDHSLIYRQQEDGEGVCFTLVRPRLKAGIRVIPMLEAVRKALLEEQLSQMRTGFNQTVIDGYSGFIFSNRYGDALTPHCINRAIERISRDYNKRRNRSCKGRTATT